MPAGYANADGGGGGGLTEPVTVEDGGGSLTVDGTVAVSNFPASVEVSNDTGNPLPVSGTVTATQGTSPWVVSGTVTVTDGAGALTVDGTVALDAASLAALEAVTVQNGAGASAVNIQDGGNSITVDGTVAVTDGGGSITIDGSVTAVSAAERAEDSAHSSGHTGLFVLGVRNDALNSMVDATGDYAALQLNSAGELRVTTSGGTPTGRDDTDDQAAVSTGLNTAVDRLYLYDGTNWDRARSAGSTGVLAVGGAAAHDTAVAGNPVLTGGVAAAENGTVTSVTAGDVTRFLADLKGVLYSQEKRPQMLGVYFAGSGPHQLAAAADAATGGRVWLVNTSSTVAVSLRKILFTCVSGTALVVLTFPRINVERITFTGTPSGATITPAKRDSTDAGNTGSVRTASTGMTITAGAVVKNFTPVTVLTAVGVSMPSEQRLDLQSHIDGRIILRQNEGLVIRQADAGTTADTRRFFLDLEWEEYTL